MNNVFDKLWNFLKRSPAHKLQKYIFSKKPDIDSRVTAMIDQELDLWINGINKWEEDNNKAMALAIMKYLTSDNVREAIYHTATGIHQESIENLNYLDELAKQCGISLNDSYSNIRASVILAIKMAWLACLDAQLNKMA